MTTRYFDRSRREAAEKCLRLRWWGYEYGSRGLEPVAPSVDLLLGSAIHEGLAVLLRGSPLDLAICTARANYQTNTETTDADMLDEELALAEALLRGWHAVRLPAFQQDYEVLETEQEHELDFPEIGAKFLVRPDAVVKRRTDGTLFVWNFKTHGELKPYKREQYRYDMQSFSEVLALEPLYGPFGGTVFDVLLKGNRLEYPKGSGRRQYYNPLLWAWKKDGVPPLADEWQARYEWTDADGKNHRLGKGWHKAPTWREYPGGLAAWLDFLLQTDRPLLEEQFITLPPILRSEWEIAEWKRATVNDEERIAYHAAALNSGPKNPVTGEALDPEPYLQAWFPKQTAGGNNCVWCQFKELCWGPHGTDPISSGLYRWRTPNHPQEQLPSGHLTATWDGASVTVDGEGGTPDDMPQVP